MESDLGAIGRPGWVAVEGGIARQVDLAAPVGVHDVHFTVGFERDLGPVRRPLRSGLRFGVGGEPGLTAAIGVHHVDLVVPVPVAHERDLGPVRRPVGLGVAGSVVRKIDGVGTVRVHLEDLEVARPIGLERDRPWGRGETADQKPDLTLGASGYADRPRVGALDGTVCRDPAQFHAVAPAAHLRDGLSFVDPDGLGGPAVHRDRVAVRVQVVPGRGRDHRDRARGRPRRLILPASRESHAHCPGEAGSHLPSRC